QRQRCWLESAGGARRDHWLSPPVESSIEPDRRYREATISGENPPWLGDHRVRGRVVFPAAGWLSLVDDDPDAAITLEQVEFERPLVVGEGAWRVQCACAGDRFTIASRPEGSGGGSWVRHAGGRIRPPGFAPAPCDLARLTGPLRCALDVFDAGGVAAALRDVAGREIRELETTARPSFVIDWVEHPLPAAGRPLRLDAPITEYGRHVLVRIEPADAPQAVSETCAEVARTARSLASRPTPPRPW